jgi:prepilin-type N-terminal cleavage/methylation domain-containing protein
MTTRRGFTMIELIVALVLTTMVAGVAYQLLANNQRVSRGQASTVGMQDNVRSGLLIVANELREIGYDSVPPTASATLVLNLGGLASSDILNADPTRIRYRAMRGFGVTCAPPTTALLKLRRSQYYGTRDPQANDKLTIFIEGVPGTGADDAWVQATVTGTTVTTCTDGTSAIGLNTSWAVAAVGTAAVASMLQGGPVRVFEVMEMKNYVSGGKSWLGMFSVTAGSAIQPVVGPLTDSTASQRGVSFDYRDKNNNTTAVLTAIRAVRVTLKGITDERVRRSNASHGGIDSLSLTTRVALRNSLRP